MCPDHRTGLGRGFDTLLPRGLQQVVELSRDEIRANRFQPRAIAEKAELDELASSIRTHGILQPIVVGERDEEGMYELIAGERRWRASGLAGLTVIPALIRSVGEQERLQLALVENLQRVNLSAVERANAFRRLKDEFDLTQEEIALTVGKSRSTVANTMRLLDLPQEALRALSDGRITEGHARALLGIKGQIERTQLLNQILDEGMSVRVVEQAARRRKTTTALKISKDTNAIWLESSLRDVLRTKVEVHRVGQGGRIVIHFYNDEDLGALVERMTINGEVSRETDHDVVSFDSDG